MNNPLLALDGPPDFHAIDPDSVEPAINTLLVNAYDALARAASPTVPADYAALSTALDVHVERLNFAWTVVTHLHAVADTPRLRESLQACLPKVTAFHTALGADRGLYRKYRAIAADPALTPQRTRAVALELQAAQLGGVELAEADKRHFAGIVDRCATLSQRFATNLLDATDRYAYYAHANELSGVPDEIVKAARQAAKAEGREGHKLGLQLTMYNGMMRYVWNRPLREKLYHAYSTRASEFGPHALDNTHLMQELLALRQESVGMLGMASHAQVSLAPKMARDPEQVIAFLHDLASAARQAAGREIEQMHAFARRELRLHTMVAWDQPYVAERMRQAQYAFSQAKVRRYFTVERVLDGLLTLVRRLFDIDVVRGDLPVWHDSVQAYRVSRDGVELGVFYLDLYARAGKRGGAWVNGMQPRWRRGEHIRTALASVVCNFAAPDERGVAMLDHSELVTLFHEFDHNLHFLLSTVEDLGVSGVSGVEWDAVELPSQLIENFAWEWDVIEGMSAHVDDGRKLPRALFARMLAAKTFQGGLALLRQIELALFDMMLHASPAPGDDIQTLLDRVRAEVALLPVPGYNRFANGFSHIFAGAYAAGYYSCLLAKVLAADAWSAFAQTGVLEKRTWDRFRSTVLEMGGSRPAADNFLAFRGRPPSQEALLRQRGIGEARQIAGIAEST